MFCNNCGKTLTEGARFCDNCGTYVQDSVDFRYDKESAQKNIADSNSGGFVPPQTGGVSSPQTNSFVSQTGVSSPQTNGFVSQQGNFSAPQSGAPKTPFGSAPPSSPPTQNSQSKSGTQNQNAYQAGYTKNQGYPPNGTQNQGYSQGNGQNQGYSQGGSQNQSGSQNQGYSQSGSQNQGYSQSGNQAYGTGQPRTGQPYPGQIVNEPRTAHSNAHDDPTNWTLFGFFMAIFVTPIVGLILYLVWKTDYPLKANAVGKGTLIGFISGIVFSLLLVFFMLSMWLPGY